MAEPLLEGPEPLEDEADLDELREPDESDDHWSQFLFWLDLKPGYRMRSSVAEHFGITTESVKKIATKYSWKARATTWDITTKARSIERQTFEASASKDQLREASRRLLQKVSRKLDEMSDQQLSRMGPKDIAMLADTADRIHRTLFGDASLEKSAAAAAKGAPGSPGINLGIQVNVDTETGRADTVARLRPYTEVLRTLPLELEAQPDPPASEDVV